jgi:lipoprotein-releasing system permease protein
MIYLAKRQLLSRKTQTLLIVLGIILGSAAYVIISGMFIGFQSYITNQLINNDATIRISAQQTSIEPKSMQETFFGHTSLIKWDVAPSGRRDYQHIENPYQWIHRLRKDPEVVAFAPQLIIEALAHKGQISTSISMLGTEAKSQTQVTNINDYMIAGSFADLKSGGNRIIVGDGLLQKMGASLGSTLLISVGNSEPKFFKIVGVFHLGVPPVDDGTVYANLSDVQKINRTPNQISDIAIRIRDIKLAHDLATQWSSYSNDKVESWDQSKANVMAVFKTQTALRYFMTISILLVAGFGIYNVLSVLINQKKKEIAILRAMGYTPKEIRRLFLYQGLIVGIMGGTAGLFLGFLICHGIEAIPLFKDSTGKVNHLKMSYTWSIYIDGFLLAFISSLIASLLPAQSASKMTPIDIIRESA